MLTDMTTSLERIADHCSNIGVSILESSEEDMGRHAYLHSVKKEDTENSRIGMNIIGNCIFWVA